MNENQTQSTIPGATSETKPRRRLRMQPLAPDAFMTFVYICIGMLLFGEFVALFWLDLFS